MPHRAKTKRSIQRAVFIIFAASLAIGLIASSLISYDSAYRAQLMVGHDNAMSAAHIAIKIIDAVGLDTLVESDETPEYAQTREDLRIICQELDLDYLYVYTTGEDELRHYVVVVASDDDEDEVVRAVRGLGSTSDVALTDYERAALAGHPSDEPIVRTNRFGNDLEWITPYMNEQGGIVALVGTDIDMNVGFDAGIQEFVSVITHFIVVLVTAFSAVFILVRRRVIVPIRTIAGAMNEFDPTREAEPLHIETQDEVQLIADAFENMSREIRDYVEDIEVITKEREQEEAQMDVARRIQEGIVPVSFAESTNGVDVAAAMHPAREVGGDFYDCFALPDGRYCVTIGDVSGKGVAGAMFMALAKTLLRERLRMDPDPADALNTVNDELCAENPEGFFVTVFALVLDPATGDVCYANGGHNPPVLLQSGDATLLAPDPGIALGLFEDADIANETISLAPGEGLLLYTDGITEAVNTQNSFYGVDCLLQLLSAWESAADGTALIDRVRNSLEHFSAGAEQFDDMTIVVITRRSDGGWQVLPVQLEAFDTIKGAVLECCGDSPEAKKAVLACDEAFANIVSHSGASYVRFRCERECDSLAVTLCDDGVPFDPLEKDASFDRDFDDLDCGGMGIDFIRSIATEVEWLRDGNENVLTMLIDL